MKEKKEYQMVAEKAYEDEEGIRCPQNTENLLTDPCFYKSRICWQTPAFTPHRASLIQWTFLSEKGK